MVPYSVVLQWVSGKWCGGVEFVVRECKCGRGMWRDVVNVVLGV